MTSESRITPILGPPQGRPCYLNLYNAVHLHQTVMPYETPNATRPPQMRNQSRTDNEQCGPKTVQRLRHISAIPPVPEVPSHRGALPQPHRSHCSSPAAQVGGIMRVMHSIFTFSKHLGRMHRACAAYRLRRLYRLLLIRSHPATIPAITMLYTLHTRTAHMASPGHRARPPLPPSCVCLRGLAGDALLQRRHGERLGPLDGQAQGARPHALHSIMRSGSSSIRISASRACRGGGLVYSKPQINQKPGGSAASCSHTDHPLPRLQCSAPPRLPANRRCLYPAQAHATHPHPPAPGMTSGHPIPSSPPLTSPCPAPPRPAPPRPAPPCPAPPRPATPHLRQHAQRARHPEQHRVVVLLRDAVVLQQHAAVRVHVGPGVLDLQPQAAETRGRVQEGAGGGAGSGCDKAAGQARPSCDIARRFARPYQPKALNTSSRWATPAPLPRPSPPADHPPTPAVYFATHLCTPFAPHPCPPCRSCPAPRAPPRTGPPPA